MAYKLPNFLIVGAARSGTTSLYHYIRQHPQIYMSAVKEPEFFAFQKAPHIIHKRNYWQIPKTLEEYKKLFPDSENYIAVGESSVVNLYLHKIVIPLIKQCLGNIKIIIILRNPIDRAYSAYMRYRQLGEEDLTFKEAIESEEKRIREGKPFAYHYTKVGMYYNQVKSYLEEFNEVRVYLFEDLLNNKSQLLKDTFAFLGVDSEFKPDTTEIHNKSGESLFPLVARMTKLPNSAREKCKKFLRIFLKEYQVSNLGSKINRLNLRKNKSKIDKATLCRLKELFRKDILHTQELIKRDLCHWLK